MRVALLTCNARAGDAIGNQAAEKLAFFRDRGADVRVFVEDARRLHPELRPYAQPLDGNAPDADAWAFLTSADLIVVEYGHAYSLPGLLPLLAGGKPRILFNYHGVTPPALWGEHNREVLSRGQRQCGLVWCADAAVVHSRFTHAELRRQTGFPAEHIFALGHAVPAAGRPPDEPARDLRDQLGIGPAVLLLFVGRLAPNKRVPVLVEALARLRDHQPPVHAVVIGDTDDVYQDEADRCRQRAAELNVADRLHLLGKVSAGRLAGAYRSADVFVMPSRHEGFCIPVVEAMAAGVPVVAARAGALPETVAGAGLTFTPDDPADLARQVARVLPVADATAPRPPRLRVAIASYRYGTDFAGGAETSLRTMATALHAAGHAVEVFTTCTRAEGESDDHYREGTETLDGIPVHRFRADRRDPARGQAAVQAVLHAGGDVPAEAEREYLAHAPNSRRLLDALRQRAAEFDAILTGPYGLGLTHAVARAFPDRTLVLPCFHDEPLARLGAWREAYGAVGGLLYHTPEEQELAETELGINHPRAGCVGTFVDATCKGDAARGRARVGGGRPYLVYCGRYSSEKGVPELLDAARRYEQLHPGRFRFVFLGEGGVAIPAEPWAVDLGFVPESVKRDVLAGAAALVQLSRCESLSLAALEAWAQGVPVLAHRACAALAGHLRRGGGGRAVAGPDEFAAALDDLWAEPDKWQALGRQGHDYLCREYGSRPALAERLAAAVRSLDVPLAECMRRRGLERAARFDREAWRRQFAEIVERVLHDPPRSGRPAATVTPRATARTVATGTATVLVPVRVTNAGTQALAAEGPGRVALVGSVHDAAGRVVVTSAATPLPDLLVPGQALAAAVPVPVPAEPGTYRVVFHAEWAERAEPIPSDGPPAELEWTVGDGGRHADDRCCAPLLESVQAALAEAEPLQRLPADYMDVTQGRFAALKRWVKRKLLGNFKRAYVDVLSRQQSAFNRHTLAALGELAECCATLDHAQRLHVLTEQLAASRAECRDLAARVRRLEALLLDRTRKRRDVA